MQSRRFWPPVKRMPPKSKNKGSPASVPETQATPGTDSLQATEGQGHADPKMMSDDQKSTIKRLIEQSQERLDPECLTYPDGIEPPASFSEQVKHLIKMIEEDDEAEVTEEDAAQLIDEIKAEITSRNEIHADFRNRRIKSVMQELSDAQHAIAEASTSRTPAKMRPTIWLGQHSACTRWMTAPPCSTPFGMRGPSPWAW